MKLRVIKNTLYDYMPWDLQFMNPGDHEWKILACFVTEKSAQKAKRLYEEFYYGPIEL